MLSGFCYYPQDNTDDHRYVSMQICEHPWERIKHQKPQIMGKRLKNLSPLGRVIADEVVCLGISVRNLCAMAHISKTTYYELLKGNAIP